MILKKLIQLFSKKGESPKINIQLLQNRLDAILDSIAGSHWWKDKFGRYLGCNKATAEIIGLASPDEIIGKTDFDMPWAKQANDLIKNDALVMSSKTTMTFEESAETEKGMVFLLTTKAPLYDEKNNVIGIVGTSVDITELKKTQKELEAANRTKSEFIANMSHDLRTPITGMLGMIQDMLNTVDQAEVSLSERNILKDSDMLKHMIETVQRDSHYLMGATDELLQLCNEILEVVRLESGNLEDNLEAFDLRELIQHNIELLQPVAHHKKLQLLSDVDQKVPHYLKGVRIYLDRILLNLISNALKFTKKGQVKISVKQLHDKDVNNSIKGKINLQIQVEDTGTGIPKDKFDTIFEHFSRLSPAYEGVYKGAGLGLYTVKRYIQAMRGQIYLESELGKGTCFTVILPFFVSDHTDRIKTSVRSLKPIKSVVDQATLATQPSVSTHATAASILVVEDNTLAAIAIKLALKPFNCHIEIAENGSNAVKMAQDAHYDLILMDVGLPDFSGIEATKKIRALSDIEKSRVPIVALTGHAGNLEMRQEALDAGMQDVISKPAQPLALESVLQGYIFKTKTQEQPTHPATTPADQASTSLQIIDWEACVHMCSGDPEFTRQMLSILNDDLKKTTAPLAEAYAKRDIDALRAELHRSRGGVCYLKLPELEQALKNFHEAVKGVPQDSHDLEKTYAELNQAIDNFHTAWKNNLI